MGRRKKKKLVRYLKLCCNFNTNFDVSISVPDYYSERVINMAFEELYKKQPKQVVLATHGYKLCLF